MTAATSTHDLAVHIAAADIDRMGHANNSLYLHWVEDAVHGHWAANATPSEFDAFLWLALRHEIDYRQPAFLGDVLQVKTRLVSVRRVRAWYETTISRGDTTLAESRSCWGCIDAASRRLTPIPADTVARFLPAG